MARKAKAPKTITDNRWRKARRWAYEHRHRLARGAAVIAAAIGLVVAVSYALHWANSVTRAARPTVTVPATPGVRGTSPVDAAKLTGAATERAASSTAQTNMYSADRAAEATDRTGRRTFIAAIGAGLLALASVIFNGLMWRQARIQHHDERRRADRLHVTDMLDKAAGKLSDTNDAVRTLAIYTLERVYNDAKLLHDGTAPQSGSPTDTLQRAVIQTLCGYVRDLSWEHYKAHRSLVGAASNDRLDGLDSYRSPNSIKAAITVLGRCTYPPAGVVMDLEYSVLADVDFRGSYPDLRLSHGAFGRISFGGGQISYLSAADCSFTERTMFASLTLGGGTIVRSVFAKEVIFEDVLWSGHHARFDGAEFRGPVHFENLQIQGDHRINEASFAERPDLSGIEFGSPPPPVDQWWSGTAGPQAPAGPGGRAAT